MSETIIMWMMKAIYRTSPVINYHKAAFHLPADSREQLLPMGSPSLAGLDAAGVRLAGLSHLTGGYRVCRKNPDFFLVLCAGEGEGFVSLNSTWHSLRPGEFFLSPPGVPQLYGVETAFSMVWFHLDSRTGQVPLAGQFPRTGRSPGACIVADAELEAAVAIAFSGLLHELNRAGSGPKQESAYGRILEQHLNRLLPGGSSSPGEPESGLSDRDPARVEILRSRIRRNLEKPWTVEALAGLVSVSPSHLYKITAQTAGCTPLELVRCLRMDWAKEMLQRSDFPLKHIAACLGYDNPYSFSKAFKRHFGGSPAVFKGANPRR